MIEEKKIKLIQFGILSPDEIKRYSVMEVQTDSTFEDNFPKKGGPMDLRLGSTEKGYFCSTDMASYMESPGYFGHISLHKPVFHEGFIEFVLLVIRCIDHVSSKLILNQNSQRIKNIMKIKNPHQRLKFVAKLCASICISDNFSKKIITNLDIIKENISMQPRYSRDGWCIIAKFSSRITSEPTRILSAESICEIFKAISDEDCRKIGLNPKLARPDWMVLCILPIPPPSVRPSVIFDLNSRAEDDLTYKLSDIIRSNNSLLRLIVACAPLQLINEQINLLQYHIGTYMNNNLPNLAKSMQKTGRLIKSIKQRLQGKEGRIRGNLMGKRVDFSARTVITPDPNISLDEVGIPWNIALNLTFPETIMPSNCEKIRKLVTNGPFCHPGAKYITNDEGNRTDLRYVKNISSIELKTGFQVERHLQDGDVVLFNRQPSLHKMSMMGHIVKIMNYFTFRMNLSATSPYNADFDGDEMNLHLPQTLEARSELSTLMMVPKCIVSQQNNMPAIGIVQDSLLGSLLLTQKDVFLNKHTLTTMLMQIDDWGGEIPFPVIMKPVCLWTGKQIISFILPKINLFKHTIKSDNNTSNITDTKVFILNGYLISGTISKQVIGSSSGGIIHICWKEYGPNRTSHFISQFQLTINHWLTVNGFSVGIEDTFVDKKTMLNIIQIIKNAKNEVQTIVGKKSSSLVEVYPDKNFNEIFECYVNKILNKARDRAGSNIQKSLSSKNNIRKMVISGSKGNFINISQIIACVGQQNIEGKRIGLAFNGRSLPHFFFENNGPETRGFVQNSYFSGLNPEEFFFHAMGGREGLVDTAIKTSETGYIQRRLSKIMEDINIEYDLTVRNTQNNILQFFYGEDSIDPIFLENQTSEFINTTNRELEIIYKISTKSPCYGLNTKGYNFLKSYFYNNKNKLEKKLNSEFCQLTRDKKILQQMLINDTEIDFILPINIQRIIKNSKNIFKKSTKALSVLPLDVVNSIKYVENFCFDVVNPNKSSKCKNFCACYKCDGAFNATFFLRMYLRITLATKLIIFKYKLDHKKFVWILNEICLHFRKSVVDPGEMIGIISAQSIGQPATQMTLNTFHYAGVSSKNVTLGVPRLKEIINILKITKTPSLSIYLKKEYSSFYKKIKTLQQSLEFTRLKDLLQSVFFFYDPDPFLTVFNKDREILTEYIEIPDYILENAWIGIWVMRMVLQKSKFIDKNLSINQVIEKIKKKIKPFVLSILNSDDNASENKIRFKIVWPNIDLQNSSKYYKKDLFYSIPFETRYLKKIGYFIMTMNVKDYGTSSIRRVFIQKVNTSTIDVTNGAIVCFNEFILDTEGTDLRYILNHSGIDFIRTFSNDILEIFKIFGIEATRQILIRELRSLISFDGGYVNFRHISLLVDVMTHRGKLTSVTRHGINKAEIGPIAKSSFEETVDIFYQAAAFGIYDNIKSVSSNIMVGNLSPVGTGKIDLFIDENKLKKYN